MTQSLLITVRFQEGRYHGQEDGFNGADGWPPSPGRLFQALVAAAAEGAKISAEDTSALKWLEELNPPRVVAPAVRRGRSVRMYVPNNDLDAFGGDPRRVEKIRVPKQWRPCFFDPDQPVLYAWDFESGLEEAARICAIAMRLYQLGRGVDMAWATGRILDLTEVEAELDSHPGSIRRPNGAGETATPGPGTLSSLVDRYRRKRRRLMTVGMGRSLRQEFTQPPKPSFRRTGYDIPMRLLHFELRSPGGSFSPCPLVSAGPLVASLRNAAANRLQEFLPDKSELFEKLIVGHGAGPADIARRIRMIPIPSVGTVYTDSSIRRIVVEVPADCPIRVDDLKWAFSGLETYDSQVGNLQTGRLVSTEDARMANQFEGPARQYKSVTPLALSQQNRRCLRDISKVVVDERSQVEWRVCATVIQALRHAGVRIAPVSVRVQREPFNIRGKRAEVFASGTRFSKAAMWHAAVTFAEPVYGPLLLGDGRYLGLGLMRPDKPTPGILVFAIETGLSELAKPDLIARAARRAMMARVQKNLPRGRLLPTYVSGHEADGSPARDGTNRHIAISVDLFRRRILYLAPNLLQYGGVQWRDVRKHHAIVERALEGMNILRAGEAGLLGLSPAILDRESDPLFASASIWESVTVYHVTRHRRRLTDEEALRADVLSELQRCGWPVPTAVDILKVHRGPKGALSGHLRLVFAVAQRGPLLLGRTAHKGGGLFANSISNDLCV